MEQESLPFLAVLPSCRPHRGCPARRRCFCRGAAAAARHPGTPKMPPELIVRLHKRVGMHGGWYADWRGSGERGEKRGERGYRRTRPVASNGSIACPNWFPPAQPKRWHAGGHDRRGMISLIPAALAPHRAPRSGLATRRQSCHSADAPSQSLLNRLPNVEGEGCCRVMVSPPASPAGERFVVRGRRLSPDSRSQRATKEMMQPKR